MAAHEAFETFDVLPQKRAPPARPVFGEEIVGSLVEVDYPDGVGRFVCRVTEYIAAYGWHKLSSVQCSPDRSREMLSGSTEEAFTDEVDLNVFWRERRLQFVGPDDDPYTHCPICKWQAAPASSCLTCADCRTRAHMRCAASLKAGRKFSFAPLEEDLISSKPYSQDNWVCPHCKSECTSSVGTPSQSPLPEPPSKRFRLNNPASSPRTQVPASPAPSQTLYDHLKLFNEDRVAKIAAEFFEQVQRPGCMRRFRFVTGTEYLQRVCGGNLNHAITALQHSATGGVLTWYHGEGESENLKLLRRGLDASDTSVQLIVSLLEISPCNQAKPTLHSKPPTVASCCHLTFGFIVLSGLRSSVNTGDSQRAKFAQVLVYAARSSHVRSIDELFAVLTERAWSHWSVLDTSDGQLIDYCAEQITESHDYLEYQVFQDSLQSFPCSPTSAGSSATSTPTKIKASWKIKETGKQADNISNRLVLEAIYLLQGVQTRHAQNPAVKRISRDNFDPGRFLLVHRGQPVDSLTREFIPAPARLIFGFGMRLLQDLGYRVLLLELALPIAGTVLRRGQGRGVEKIAAVKGFKRCKAYTGGASNEWPIWMPQMGDHVLELTSNASAYKTYRAFGLGEHIAWNRLKVNHHADYLYPVLGCVLDQNREGGVTAEQIRKLSVREIPSLKGIGSWLTSVKQRAEIKAVREVVVFDKPTIEDLQFQQDLARFEDILDKVSPSKLGAKPDSEKRVYGNKEEPAKTSLWCAALSLFEDPSQIRRSVRIPNKRPC